ncbi:uncharacterized protein KD926_010244 [Aspergillus affinis]|uniref:uncharacterized protein n=1 Tax=Aspergillus affinis TaxID=1070780 RepID=UPI0022FE342D|nr:uncharacterized protein KD926_010244 [Aspergillus affinis]KAI9038788.1 hypothetical protein KD926_010244 [Aspergillus affinis]
MATDQFLSNSLFDCIDFHNIEHVDPKSRQGIVNRLQLVHLWFFNAVDYEHRVEHDAALRTSLRQWAEYEIRPLVQTDEDGFTGLIDFSAEVSEYFYPLASHDTKVKAAMGCVAAFTIDDASLDTSVKDMEDFALNIWKGSPPKNKWCAMFSRFLKFYAEYFGAHDPWVGNLGAVAWSNYVGACTMKDRMTQALPFHLSDHPLPKTTKYTPSGGSSRSVDCTEQFPGYMREQTGFPATCLPALFRMSDEREVPFRYWNSAIPLLNRLICTVNDLLSCSKETLAGENDKYVSLMTRAKRQEGAKSRFGAAGGLWTFRDTLCGLLQLTVDMISSLDKAFVDCAEEFARKGALNGLVDDPGEPGSQEDIENMQLAADRWIAFRHDTIAYYLNCRRYDLESLVAIWQWSKGYK